MATASTRLALVVFVMRAKPSTAAWLLGAFAALAACGDSGPGDVGAVQAPPPDAGDEAGPTDAGCDGPDCPDASDAPVGPPPCGATGPEKCPIAADCTTDADCASGQCNDLFGPTQNKCISAPSCQLTPGADQRCGGGTDDCCASIAVPGGTFNNVDINGNVEIATVSPFKLDVYEITVGRLRAYYTAKNGDLRDNPPTPGSGAHPKIPWGGWRESFNIRLPGSWKEINERMVAACSVGGDNANFGATTWTPDPGPNEDKPANCIDWYTFFSFCVWDGGRLPTDAEWSYVAYGGDENRVYPYGNQAPTFSAVSPLIVSDLQEPPNPGYMFTYGPRYRSPTDGPAQISPVGTKVEKSKWGQADLTGNVLEMTMDLAQQLPAYCTDCANVSWPDPPQNWPPVQPPKWETFGPDGGPVGDEFGEERAAQDGIRLARGSSWQGEWGGHFLANGKNRFFLPVWRTYSAAGARCARDLGK